MSTTSISNKLKERILSLAQSMDNNEMRFMYLLRNLGPQQFEKLIEYSGLSRSTVSKYLKIHEQHQNIEKRLVEGKQKYCITEKGIERLQVKPNINEVLYREFDDNISKLSEMFDFYKKIGVDETIALQIVRIVSKLGKKFFNLEQNRDLYITLIYIFLNSVITPEYKYEISSFREHYKIKKIRIDYFVEKIMSSNLGFFMFTRTHPYGEGEDENEDIFFFHEDDIVGTTTLRLVKDKLTEEIIQLNKIYHDKYELSKISETFSNIYDLDVMAKEIAEKLLKMNLIWGRDEEKKILGIIEPFKMLIEKIIVKSALEMGFSRTFLMDLVVQSELLAQSIEGKKSLFNIIDGSDRYEDLNLVSIEEPEIIEEKTLDELLEQVQGFCPNCGKIIQEQFSDNCPKCNQEYDSKELLKDIDKAHEASLSYKEFILEKEIECPNKDCKRIIQSSWEECPYCHTIF